MIEVFKTNVHSEAHARLLLAEIHLLFVNYHANFDLSDCDRILRVQYSGLIESARIIELLEKSGYSAEVLKDEVHSFNFNT